MNGGRVNLFEAVFSSGEGNTIDFQSITLPAQRVDFAIGGSLEVRSTIAGGGGVPWIKFGGGRLTLSGNNTFTSGVNLNFGTLVVGSNTALGSGGLAWFGGTIESSTSVTLANRVDLLFGGGYRRRQS